jgi:hypothetical protein
MVPMSPKLSALPPPARLTALRWISLLAVAAPLSGCAIYPLDAAQEVEVDSIALAPRLTYGVVATPFCLHLKYQNGFKVVYSDHQAEAWVTDGSCASKGARRKLETLALSWRYDTYTQQDKFCGNADTCTMNEHRILEGRLLQCVSARAREGDQSAFISTDQAACR